MFQPRKSGDSHTRVHPQNVASAALWYLAIRRGRSVPVKVARAASMPSIEWPSTKTCGARRTRPATGPNPVPA